MVIGNIKDCEKYCALHPDFRVVFEGLKKLSGDSDRVEVNGENAFYSASTYINKPAAECKYEAHRKYIDIQYVVSGLEEIRLAPAEQLDVTQDFTTDGDIAFYGDTESYQRALLGAGDFVIIFPCEAHMPLVAPFDNPTKTTKAVAKIKA